jgi:hypothetical protein
VCAHAPAGMLAGHSAAAAHRADAPRAPQGLLTMLKLPSAAADVVPTDVRFAAAPPADVLARFEAGRLESRAPTAPPAPAAAATGAKAFLEQAKKQLTRDEYLQVRRPWTRTRAAALAARRLTRPCVSARRSFRRC